MRLLILGINYAPEIISTAVYTTGLAQAMSSTGHEVVVVAAQPYYPAWRIFDGYPKYRHQSESSGSGPAVIRCPHFVPQNPTGAKRILHHLSFALSAMPPMIWQGLRHRPDVVFVVAPSLISAPLGWIVARLAGAKCWLHVQDFEVEAGFATGLLHEHGLLGRLAQRFEAWIFRRFDKISTISEPMLAKLVAKGLERERVFELRNWADLSRIAPLAKCSPLRQSLAISTRHVALYAGNIGNKQGLEILPELARRLSHRDDLTIAICGDGPFLPELKRLSHGLRNVRFFPLQPVAQLNNLLGMATVHLLPQIAGAADLVLPSKLTNMLASGRPVLATADRDTALAREVAGCGVVVPPADEAAFAAALENLLDSPETRDALGTAARARALERWDGTRILKRFNAELEALVSRLQAATVDVDTG
ncbi:MAG: WcaI family glycosyltransferase [Halocynthiibacter sp.]